MSLKKIRAEHKVTISKLKTLQIELKTAGFSSELKEGLPALFIDEVDLKVLYFQDTRRYCAYHSKNTGLLCKVPTRRKIIIHTKGRQMYDY